MNFDKMVPAYFIFIAIIYISRR